MPHILLALLFCGTVNLEVVAGGGHDLNPAWFQSQPLVDFVITCSTPPKPAR